MRAHSVNAETHSIDPYVKENSLTSYCHSGLTRHHLGNFLTHDRRGGDGRIRPLHPPCYLETNGRIEPREAACESFFPSRTYDFKIELKFPIKLSGQGQVKGQILTFLYDEA